MAFDRGVRLETGRPGSWIALGSANWLYWRLPHWHDVRIRVDFDDAGRPVVTAVHVDVVSGQDVIAASDLRALPLGRLQSFMSSSEHLEALVASDDLPPTTEPCFHPRLSRLDAERLAQELPAKRISKNQRIHGAGGRGAKPDRFYRDVADAFFEVSLATSRPADLIAEANGVATTTVHRWLKEARRRGVLSPARRSDASRRAPNFDEDVDIELQLPLDVAP